MTDPKTTDTDSGAEGAADDVQSDPSQTGEWLGEGGATVDGPSTDTE